LAVSVSVYVPAVVNVACVAPAAGFANVTPSAGLDDHAYVSGLLSASVAVPFNVTEFVGNVTVWSSPAVTVGAVFAGGGGGGGGLDGLAGGGLESPPPPPPHAAKVRVEITIAASSE
jgi:hypothetical protein